MPASAADFVVCAYLLEGILPPPFVLEARNGAYVKLSINVAADPILSAAVDVGPCIVPGVGD